MFFIKLGIFVMLKDKKILFRFIIFVVYKCVGLIYGEEIEGLIIV